MVKALVKTKSDNVDISDLVYRICGGSIESTMGKDVHFVNVSRKSLNLLNNYPGVEAVYTSEVPKEELKRWGSDYEGVGLYWDAIRKGNKGKYLDTKTAEGLQRATHSEPNDNSI